VEGANHEEETTHQKEARQAEEVEHERDARAISMLARHAFGDDCWSSFRDEYPCPQSDPLNQSQLTSPARSTSAAMVLIHLRTTLYSALPTYITLIIILSRIACLLAARQTLMDVISLSKTYVHDYIHTASPFHNNMKNKPPSASLIFFQGGGALVPAQPLYLVKSSKLTMFLLNQGS